MSVQVRPLTPLDREAWARLRYRVAVEQLGRDSLAGVDHGRRMLEDRLDDSAHAIGAFSGTEMIGGVRSHYCREVAEHPLYGAYQLDEVDDVERLATSVTTHLMIDGAWRKRGVGLALIAAMFELNTGRGMRYDRIDVFEENRPLFERMGYVASGPPFDRPGFGVVLPLRLDTEDVEHLEACRSPLRRRLRRERVDPRAIES